ncbi:alpha/beta hydrolase [Luteimonas sp. SX5]|uniref:Proline iminopeptidase n=1 Tax=Luteimonas galliterrae TaxID=2940486 RepID=A0ABT0MEG9_9GAMM|nr:alpha/beta hydrolase [Luteimonas galliterrae]MCL1633262.1 alpha/beta hydrolase [Luteimonas galliterrae]
MFERIRVIAIAATLAMAAPQAMAADKADGLREAARIIGDAQKIVGEDGIQTTEQIELGGIRQTINIRGRHRHNPILLVLHGGPGLTMMPVSHMYLRPLEEFFTVVQWDQRGAGRTYAANDPEKVRPTMTVERMLGDAEELAAYLRKRYARDKIVLMGHSWGTVLGTELAQKHPDWFYAYVGVSQVVDIQENERLGYAAVMQWARSQGNAQAVRELESVAPYPPDPAKTPVAEQRKILDLQRKWLTQAGGYLWRRAGDHYGDVASISPEYSPGDLQAWGKGLDFSLESLWPQLMALDFMDHARFDCPVVLLHGRHDLNASAELAGRWFEKIQAPSKKMVWFDYSGHMIFEEEPGRFMLSLVRDVLPLTTADTQASR